MKKVLKFGLLDLPKFFVDMPEGAQPLHLAMLNNRPTLWALVDPEARKLKYKIFCVFTDEPLPPGTGEYIGTVQDGEMVLHYFFSLYHS